MLSVRIQKEFTNGTYFITLTVKNWYCVLDRYHRFEFWESTNMPEFVETEKFFFQKLKYIHDNPVKREYVEQLENWHWSSANPNCSIKIASVYDNVE